MFQSEYPEKLEWAEQECRTICLPDLRNTKDVPLDEDFFSKHILSEDESGYFSSSDGSVTAEEKDSELRLLSCPGYLPSYHRGLYSSNILLSVYQANEKFANYRMLILDKPLVPRFCKMGNKQTKKNMENSATTRRRRTLVRQESVSVDDIELDTDRSSVSNRPLSSSRPTSGSRIYKVSRPSSCSRISTTSTTMTRLTTSSSIESRRKLKKQKSIDSSKKLGTPSIIRKSPSPPPRQISADSGIDPDLEDTLFDLPPRITSYAESESFLMNQPNCPQFVSYLHRSVAPIRSELEEIQKSEKVLTEEELAQFANKTKRLCQDSLISFPKTASSVARSPRYQEMLKVAVENVVIQFIHDLLWPLIKQIYKQEDKRIHWLLTRLWRKGFNPEQLGLNEEWAIPLPAALVEMAAMDIRTTPLDKLSLIHDTIDQIHTHVRSAVLEATQGYLVEYPGPEDEVLLLSGVLVQSRLLHLMSSIKYVKTFTFSKQPDMMTSLQTLENAMKLLETPAMKTLRPPSSKMKREYSLEDIIGLTDELEQRYDRHGQPMDNAPLSTIDIHKEKLASRLEMSSKEMTKHQEEAWAKLDTCAPPLPNNSGRSILRTLHSKLLCSSKSTSVVEC